RVFEVVCTPERLPEWNVSVDRGRRAAPAEPVCLGSRAIFSGRLLGQPLESETEGIHFEHPRLFVTRAIRRPRPVTRLGLEPLPQGSRVAVDVTGEVPGGRLGAMLAEGFLRKQLTESLERLRFICERES